MAEGGNAVGEALGVAHGSRRGDDQAVGHLLPGGEIGIDFLFGSDAVHSPSLYLLNMDKRVWHGRS